MNSPARVTHKTDDRSVGDMKDVTRYDIGSLTPAQRTDEGYIITTGILASPGVYPYRRADGTVVHELIDEEELFRGDSMTTAERKPLTLQHPPEMVTPENVREYQVGDISDIRREDGQLAASIAVRDAKAIAAIERGVRQLSVGYRCNLDETPGVWRGQRYDARQVGRRVNHVAIVEHGRHGRRASLRMDAADATQEPARLEAQEDGARNDGDASTAVPPQATLHRKVMAKVKIDGVEYEFSDAATAQAMAKVAAERNDAREALKQAAEQAKTLAADKDRLDGEKTALQAQVDQLNERNDAVDINARVAVRMDLLGVAAKAKVEGADKLDDAGIRKAVIAATYPKTKLDGFSDEKIEGMFIAARDQVERADSSNALRGTFVPKTDGGLAAPTDFDARMDAAQKSYIKSRKIGSEKE